MSKKFKQILLYITSGVGVVAAGAIAMWLLIPPTVNYDSLDITAPENYEQIFEVFMAAQARMEAFGSEEFFDEDNGSFNEESYLGPEEELIGEDLIDGEGLEGGFDEPIDGDSGGFSDTGIGNTGTEGENPAEEGSYSGDIELNAEGLAFGEQINSDESGDANIDGTGDGLVDFDYDFIDQENEPGDDWTQSWIDELEDEWYEEWDDEFFFEEDIAAQNQDHISMGYTALQLAEKSGEGAQNPSRILAYAPEGNDTSYLYIATGGQLQIVRLDSGGDLVDLGTVAFDDAVIDEGFEERLISLFRLGNQLIVIGATTSVISDVPESEENDMHPNDAASDTVPGEVIIDNEYLTEEPLFTTLRVLDILDPANPTLQNSFEVTGIYLGSRILGNQLFLATEYDVFDYEKLRVDAPETFIPYVVHNGERTLALATDIRIAADMEDRDTVYAQLLSFAISDKTRLQSQIALLGGTDVLYAGSDGFYFVQNAQISQRRSYTVGANVIHVARRDGIVFFANHVSLPGVIESPDYMNESAGILRVVAPSFNSTGGDDGLLDMNYSSELQVFTVDQNMEVLGRLGGIADAYDYFPKFFVGDLLYISPFDEDQPDYLVDFSKPDEPELRTFEHAGLLPDVVKPWIALDIDNNASLTNATGMFVALGGLSEDEDVPGADEDEWNSSIKLSMLVQQADGYMLEVKSELIVEGFHSSEVFFDQSKLFVDARTGIVGFPADGSYLIYSFVDNSDETDLEQIDQDEADDNSATGIFRQLEIINPDGNFDFESALHVIPVGDYLVLINLSDAPELWAFYTVEFAQIGHLQTNHSPQGD